MDLKNILEEWKNYQKNKLVMANLYPCSATIGNSFFIQGYLSFCGSGENRHLLFVGAPSQVKTTFLLSEILGTTPEGSAVRLSLSGERTMVLQFSSETVQIAAHEAFLKFQREESGSTPSTSSNSSSSSNEVD